MENKDIIVGALVKCSKREDIELVFGKFGISDEDFIERRNLLLEAMGSPKMFFSVGEPTDKQKYELTVQMFLSMSWKFSAMCRERGL
ncbi:MAG: hypothetical protein ACTTJ6_00590 [Treponema sp.]